MKRRVEGEGRRRKGEEAPTLPIKIVSTPLVLR